VKPKLACWRSQTSPRWMRLLVAFRNAPCSRYLTASAHRISRIISPNHQDRRAPVLWNVQTGALEPLLEESDPRSALSTVTARLHRHLAALPAVIKPSFERRV